MSNETPEERRNATSGLCLLLFIGLLVIKAMGYDMPWLIVLSPIWGRILFIMIEEILNPTRKE